MAEIHRHARTRTSRIARNTALTAEVRGNRAYLSATRNPYDAPVSAYTGSEASTPPPPRGTQERFAWEKKIGELRARGLSYVNIAVEMDTSEAMVRRTCQLHGFTKGMGE